MTLLRAVLLLVLAHLAGPARAQEMYAAPASPVEVAPLPDPPRGWDTVYAPFLRVHGAPEDYPTLLHLARHGARSLPRLATELGVPIGDTIHVYVATSDAEFRALQPGRAPLWADGVAWPGLGAIFLHSPRARDNTGTPIEQVLDHELVHVVLGRAFQPHPVPLWLQEGVAEVQAGEVGPHTTRGMANTGLMGLTALTDRFPDDPVKARLAYAQSAHFVGFLRAEYGPEALPTLIRHLAAGHDIDRAVHAATGHWLDDVDAAWRASLQTGIPLSFTALTADGVLLGLGGLALLVGGVLRRRQFHRRLAEMEAEEALVDELVERFRADEAEQAVVAQWRAMHRAPGSGPT